MIKILVMGLPGSGKTTFSNSLRNFFNESRSINCVEHLNADNIRKKFNDWDFSKEGRIRQSLRMSDLLEESTAEYTIADFIAPLPEMRKNVKADWVIWLDTIEHSRYKDTDDMFIAPKLYDFRIPEQNSAKWAYYVGMNILENKRRPKFDWKKETVQMLGRWQPWHKGHRALFEKAIVKTEQVVIQIRDCNGWKNSNPFNINQIENSIRKDLDPLYQGQYEIQTVPNIVNITYGRDVGYKIEKEVLNKEIENISATKIREEMKL
jgi:phosphopantetheine adenylyltransferase